jgi:hypothetical protein
MGVDDTLVQAPQRCPVRLDPKDDQADASKGAQRVTVVTSMLVVEDA